MYKAHKVILRLTMKKICLFMLGMIVFANIIIAQPNQQKPVASAPQQNAQPNVVLKPKLI